MAPRAPALGPATATLSPASSHGAPPVADAPIDAATRAQVIDTALEKIAKYYVDPDVASGATVQSWTAAYVPGKRYGKEKPVYVLTSAKTVSAAEGALRRATVIGETTVGGANPGHIFRAGDHFRIQIAQGRALNPVTKTTGRVRV